MTQAPAALFLPAAGLILSAGLAGCTAAFQPIAVALAGAGTSSAISQTMSGTTFRTFTAPVDEVEQAVLDTFLLMGFQLSSVERPPAGNANIRGTATSREIKIELEAITPKTTRMRVEAKNGGFFYDGATATEIVLQTEKALRLGAETSDSSYGGGPARR